MAKISWFNLFSSGQPKFQELSTVERASRLIFLNKTCYNKLFRVNSQGQFNVPFGDYKNPNIVNEIIVRAVHQYLSSNDVQILNQDFVYAASTAKVVMVEATRAINSNAARRGKIDEVLVMNYGAE